MLSPTPAERISEDTWNRLKQAQELEVRLGEETLTDILTLDFARLAETHEVRLFQTPKPEEARKGTDLEVFLNTGGGAAIRYAIQAKKLYPDMGYIHINAKAGKSGRFQIDVLEDHAKSVGAIPLYLLYNYIDHAEVSRCWKCCKCPVDEKQLGCTLVPSWHVREAIRRRGRRTFHFLHSNAESLPLRCRFECPSRSPWEMKFEYPQYQLELFEGIDASFPEKYSWVNLEPRERGWPEWLWAQGQRIISENKAEEMFPGTTRETALPRPRMLIADEVRELFPGSTNETPLPRRILLVGQNSNAEDILDDSDRPAR